MARSPQRLPLLLVVACALGCSEGATERVTPRFDPTLAPAETDAATWLGFPFPSDHRRDASGRVRWDDFPNPYRISMLDRFLDEAGSALDGFSLQGMTYVAFEGGGLDAVRFGDATSAADSLEPDFPILLVDVTEGAASFGTRWPLRTAYFPLGEDGFGAYLPPHVLAVGPAWGFPLEEAHTYAVVVRDGVRAEDGSRLGRPALVDALLDDAAKAPRVSPAVPDALYQSLRTRWSGLRAYLAGAAVDPESVVVASVFTTASATSELASVAEHLEAGAAPTMAGGFDPQPGGGAFVTRTFRWNTADTVSYAVYRGRYVAPNFQEGELPYAQVGGALHFEDGTPTKVFDETIEFVLTVPSAGADPTRGCVPLVLYAHGTGGSRNSAVNEGVAGRLAARGMASLTIDQPLHGIRAQGMDLPVEQLSFNYANPTAFRSNFRQGAIDLVSLTRFARESLAIPSGQGPSGEAIAFCDETVGFMGHSQGGLTGSLALPFLEDVGTFVLSAAGGGTMTSVMDRTDTANFGALIEVFFRVPADEGWSEDHPLGTLVQSLSDVSDPASYARYQRRDPRFRGPANVMLTSGLHDTATPPRSANVLALAAALPLTSPVVVPIPAYELLDLAPIAPPFSANVGGRTCGYLQYGDDLAIEDADTHFLVFDRPEAIDATMHFLATGTAAGGVAELRRDPDADAR